MKSLYEFLRDRLSLAIEQSFPELRALGENLLIAEVTPTPVETFGHYQCNSALKIGKVLGKSPRLIAEEMKKAFSLEEETGSCEIAGPGFLNIRFTPTFLSAEANEQLADPKLGAPLPRYQGKTIVEFSSPNIAKELHVGHLRSTIIGDAIARILSFVGYDVIRLNHVGDWGTQFGMLISFLKKEEPEVLTGKKETTLSDLVGWYRAAKELFDRDEAFKKEAQLEVVALQGGEKSSVRAWELICAISRLGFDEIYELLDVELTERGESFYNPYLSQIVSDLEAKGLVTLSDGAKCVFLDGFTGREGEPLPMIVQKSDGGYNYSTTDMAAMWHRITKEKAKRIIVITDGGQALHFAMIAAASEKAGYLDPKEVRFDHVPFGVVLGATGKKFKTRSGEVEKLIDLLHEAVERARGLLQEKITDATEQELDEGAKILGIDALKYADLSSARTKDYTFSYDRMLRFEGNTAPFLLYAYVRILGIEKKVGKEADLEKQKISLEHPTEISLALHLRRFPEILSYVVEELLPHRLCDYLYEAAEKFHAFFRDCRVAGSDLEGSRLLLCRLTARVLQTGLNLLGLKTMDRM